MIIKTKNRYSILEFRLTFLLYQKIIMEYRRVKISIFNHTNQFVMLVILAEISLTNLVPYTTSDYLPILSLQYNRTKESQTNFSSIQKLGTNSAFSYKILKDNSLQIESFILGRSVRLNQTQLKISEQIYDISGCLGSGREIHILLSNNSIQIYSQYYKTTKALLPINNTSSQSIIKSTSSSCIIIDSTNSFSAILKRYGFARNYNYTFNLTTNKTQKIYSQYNMTIQYFGQVSLNVQGQLKADVCRSYTGMEYIIVWNSSLYMQMFKCYKNSCNFSFFKNYNINTNDWTTDKIYFTDDCTHYLLETDNIFPVSYFNISGFLMSSYSIQSIIIEASIYSSQNDHGVLILPNNSMIIISLTQNNTFIAIYPLQSTDKYTHYLSYYQEVFIQYSISFLYYKFGCWQMTYMDTIKGFCINCSNTCNTCSQSKGNCITCIDGYVVNGYNCTKYIPIISNKSNTLNNSNTSNTPVNSTDDTIHSNAASANQTIDNNLINSSETKLGTISQTQYEIATSTLDTFNILGFVISKIFISLNILPLVWLFLKFMNFWSICSFYVFLTTDIPAYLRTTLKIIYDNINSNAFDISWLTEKMLTINQKLPYQASQFGISSNFFIMNMQNFIMFTITITPLAFIYIMEKHVSAKSWFYRKIVHNIDYVGIISNQFISYAPSFILSLSLIRFNSNQQTIQDTINVILLITFIGISIGFPFFILSFDSNYNSYKSKKNIINKKNKFIMSTKRHKQLFKKIQWTYLSNSNTIIPFMSIIGSNHAFLMTMLIFYLFGLWMAYKTYRFRINQIIMAVQKLIFHISYMIIVYFGQYDLNLKHNLTITCVLILLIGAIHQLITFVFGISYFIFQQIRKMFQNKVSHQIEMKSQKQDKKSQIQMHNIINATRNQLKIVKKTKKLQNLLKNQIEQGDLTQLYQKQQNYKIKENNKQTLIKISEIKNGQLEQDIQQKIKSSYFGKIKMKRRHDKITKNQLKVFRFLRIQKLMQE